jgi:hypothetical protein
MSLDGPSRRIVVEPLEDPVRREPPERAPVRAPDPEPRVPEREKEPVR